MYTHGNFLQGRGASSSSPESSKAGFSSSDSSNVVASPNMASAARSAAGIGDGVTLPVVTARGSSSAQASAAPTS